MTKVPRLHLISDRRRCSEEQFPHVARTAAGAGVDAVHIRERDLSDDELLLLTQRVKASIAGAGCLLLVNDRIDIAVRAGADGVHLPERSGSLAEARACLPANGLVGVSIHSLEAAKRAAAEGADYVIAGHIYETASKPGQSGRGLAFVREISHGVDIPVIGIGGITADNVGDVLSAGAHGVAVISAILSAPDPGQEAARFRGLIDEFEV